MKNQSLFLTRASLLSFVALAGGLSPVVAVDHVWNFENAGDPLVSSGGGSLGYYDPDGTGWGPVKTVFGAASSFDLPALPGWDAGVMSIPACAADEGYELISNGLANGVFGDQGRISNYTLVMDVLYPSTSQGQFRALYQTGPDNLDDAEMYIDTANGMGISGRYTGEIQAGTWHRVVIVVRAAPGEGQLHKYIDGTFVGGQGTTGRAIDERWSLNAGDPLLLFTDDGGATAPAFVSSVRFLDRNLDYDEVVALGKATAAGAAVAGPAADPFPYELPREVDIIAHRGESGFFPENTLAALEAAFDRGADYSEVDIRLSSDGVAVLMHDGTVDRTTDGTGATAGLSAAQLTALDAGSWFGDAFVGEPVPTLEQAYALAKSKGGRLYLDIKVTGMENAIKNALDGSGVSVADTWMWVYNNEITASALRSLMPGAKIIWGEPGEAWRTDPNYWDNMRAMGVFGYDLGSGTGNIDAEFALAARAEGFYISNYTLLDPDALINSVTNGAMGLETDFVEVAELMMPPYDIVFPSLPPIAAGTLLGPGQLNATSNIPGNFTYDPPAGTEVTDQVGAITATFTPDDLLTYPVRSVTVPIQRSAGPVDLILNQAEYEINEDIVVSWENGPGNDTDWIGIYPPGVIPDGNPASTIWNYANGTQGGGSASGQITFSLPNLPAGEWNAFFMENDGYNVLGGPITFTVKGSDLESFYADSISFEPDGEVTLRWRISGAQGVTSLTVSDGVTSTDVLGQNSLTLSAPAGLTTYTLAIDGVASAELVAFPAASDGASVTTERTEFLVGEDVEVSFTGGSGNPTDWIGIYPSGIVPDGNPPSTRWAYLSGTQQAGIGLTEGSLAFPLSANPLPAGDYVIFFLQNDGYERAGDPIQLRISEELSVKAVMPVITDLRSVGDSIGLTWVSTPGFSYQVETSPNLSQWTDAGDPVTADSESTNSLVLPDFVSEGPAFFRVRIVE